jgi:hypothetical protein
MRVLIQDPRSQKYLSYDHTWSSALADAEDFVSPLNAIAAAKASANGDFRLVLYFPGKDGSPDFLVGTAPAES